MAHGAGMLSGTPGYSLVSFLRSEATLALTMGELAAPKGQTERVSHPMRRSEPSTAVPSQSACSADSSPKGRAKGAVSASATNYNLLLT